MTLLSLFIQYTVYICCVYVYSFSKLQAHWADTLPKLTTINAADAASILRCLASRQKQAVTDMHILSTALHPRYLQFINNEALHDQALTKLASIASKRNLDSTRLLEDFGDLQANVSKSLTTVSAYK